MFNLLRDFYENFEMDHSQVFLVDDDPDILNLLKVHLTKNWKFSVQTFETVEEVKAMIENGLLPPALIISDVKMPDDNGLTLKYKTRDIPIIFMTALRTSLIDNDDFTIISKPLDLRKLDELILRYRPMK